MAASGYAQTIELKGSGAAAALNGGEGFIELHGRERFGEDLGAFEGLLRCRTISSHKDKRRHRCAGVARDPLYNSSNPVIPGIRISHRTTATSLSRKTLIASAPDSASITSNFRLLKQPHDQRPDPWLIVDDQGERQTLRCRDVWFDLDEGWRGITHLGDMVDRETPLTPAPCSDGSSSRVPPCEEAMPCEIE